MSNPVTPPELPVRDRRGAGIFVFCAHLSWIAPILFGILAVVVAMTNVNHGATGLHTAAVAGAGLGLGIISAIIAMCGIGKHGRQGILIPVIVGVIVCGAFAVLGGLAAIAWPSFLKARARALEARVVHPVNGLRAATHRADAERLQDQRLGFTLDVPQEFQPFPEGTKPAGYLYGYLKQGAESDPAAVFFVKPLNRILPPRRITSSELPKDKGLILSKSDWRGLEVDTVRVPEEALGKPYVTYNVLIPLKGGGIQLSFGDIADNEAATRERLVQTLASLEGETTW